MTKVIFHLPADIEDEWLEDVQENPFDYLVEMGIGTIKSWEVSVEVIDA